jgi:hypothetical protein
VVRCRAKATAAGAREEAARELRAERGVLDSSSAHEAICQQSTLSPAAAGLLKSRLSRMPSMKCVLSLLCIWIVCATSPEDASGEASAAGVAAMVYAPTTLPEAEQNRIRAEEIFRHEVTRKIETEAPKDSVGRRLWTLLNSSFALWFLSSVLVGGLTAAVTKYQKRYAERMRVLDLRRRLKTEISSRIADGLVALHLEEKRIVKGAAYYALTIYNQTISYLDNHVTSEGKLLDFSIYPEYRPRRFRSLIIELSALAEPATLAALSEAQQGFAQLVELADQVSTTEDYSKPADESAGLEAARKSIESLNRLQANPCWQS